MYGGAGVHIEYLSRELARLVDVSVYCFGEERTSPLVASAYQPWSGIPAERHGSALRTMSVGLRMAADVEGADIVHSHTWYANFGGHLSQLLYDIPHVMTAHSLEPFRPWKAEQLGAGYALSSYCEGSAMDTADAIIAVSEAMRRDVLQAYPTVEAERVQVIHNGIDPEEYRPDGGTEALIRYGIDPDSPMVVFLGRVTRQKGITHFVDAIPRIAPDAQIVLCAGAPDTPELGAEIGDKVARLQQTRGGVFWIAAMLPRVEVVQILSHASVFVCPSVYEPFGIINLEAMACGLPVVASATGGIPEIVLDGTTGYLVPFEAGGDAFGSPRDPAHFAGDLAERVNELLANPQRARAFGAAGRRRVVEEFSWRTVAERTVALYRRLLA